MGLFRKAAVLTIVVSLLSAAVLAALDVTGTTSGQQDPAKAEESTSYAVASARTSAARVSSRLKPPPARAKYDKGPAYAKGCADKRRDAKVVACGFGPGKAETSIALFGDSHALQYSPAFIALAKRRGLRVVTYLRGDCVIANVNYDRRCTRWRKAAIRQIAKQRPDRIVVASSTGNQYVVKRGGRKLNRRASERFLRAGMARTFRQLLKIRADGKRTARVTLLRDQALAPFRPPDCLRKNRKRPSKCAFRIRRPNPPGFDWAGAKRVPKVRIVQPMNRFCGKRWCPAVSGNIVVFRDKYHLSATYARTLAGWLASRVGI